jgi:hypothetical protein
MRADAKDAIKKSKGFRQNLLIAIWMSLRLEIGSIFMMITMMMKLIVIHLVMIAGVGMIAK